MDQHTKTLTTQKYLGKGSGVDNHLIVLGHLLQEIVCSWPFQYEYIAESPLNVDRNNIIWFLNLLKLAVDQRFVQIQNEGLPPS